MLINGAKYRLLLLLLLLLRIFVLCNLNCLPFLYYFCGNELNGTELSVCVGTYYLSTTFILTIVILFMLLPNVLCSYCLFLFLCWWLNIGFFSVYVSVFSLKLSL
jgi:hypothetical protein